ncbi:hypothetical protein JTB14_024703 [Gonioctena quinquepunctata]|nr:hypothetical protein JTB14_024703 [Gonioctena quinquepunctata]
MVLAHFTLICIFGMCVSTSISAQICTHPSQLHPEPESIYFVEGTESSNCEINVTSTRLQCDHGMEVDVSKTEILEGELNPNSKVLECSHDNKIYRNRNKYFSKSIPIQGSCKTMKQKESDIVTLKILSAFQGYVDERKCYEKTGYVYKLSGEPLVKYAVLFEGAMALAFSMPRNTELHFANNRIIQHDDIVNRFQLKIKSQLQRPLMCENTTLTYIFQSPLREKNTVFDYMKQDCETQLLQSYNLKKKNEVVSLVEEPYSYSYYDDYFLIFCIFVLFSAAASFVNAIVNFVILRKAKGYGMHLCYGIFFPAFVLRVVYGDIQRDQDLLAEVIFLKSNEIDKKKAQMIVEDFMMKRGSKHYDYIKSSGYLTTVNHYNEISLVAE